MSLSFTGRSSVSSRDVACYVSCIRTRRPYCGIANLGSLRFGFSRGVSRFAALGAVLLLPVADSRADSIFGQHRAVNLDRGQRKLADDVRVLDLQGFIHRLTLHPLGGEGR